MFPANPIVVTDTNAITANREPAATTAPRARIAIAASRVLGREPAWISACTTYPPAPRTSSESSELYLSGVATSTP